MQSMPKIYLPSVTALPLPQQVADIEDKRSSSFFIENGELKFYDGVKVTNVKVNGKDRAQMLLAMDMRDSVRKVIDIQVNDGSNEELETAQKVLNDVYDKYVKIYGHICEDASLKKIFSTDSGYPLLRSLEEYGKDGYRGKSPIFSKRMIEPHRKPSHADSPADALAISMQEVGRVELDYMKGLTGQTEEELVKALEFDRIYFDFQKREYQIAEEYLSGDVRAKIEFEEKTQRLVIRGYNGEQVLFLDMNEYNYADQLGLSTALRTDAYTDDTPGTGTRCVNFPSAPCVDDNVGIQVRVQMNCGMYYDVNIKRAYVIDPETGFVDRNKVMREIVDGVNEQEGHDIMGLTVHVDKNGEELDNSSAIYFLSGEAFTVVDMPFTDPVWSDYSGGIAAQLGIHGGVTSNLAYTEVPIKDSMTFQEAYDEAGATGSREPDGTIRGTIRFASLGHEVEIDVSSSDTVKDVMDRLRVQAGDWLYVNYYDQHMGQAARNSGDYPLISLSAVDGSAVSVLDVKGHIAQDALGLSTGVQTRLNPDGDESDDSGIMGYVWDMDNQVYPAAGLTLTVAGYEHTIDLTEIREVTDNTQIQADDIAKFICSRMQDYDVLAEVNKDNELMIWSARGYSVEVKFTDSDGESITDTFLGDEESARSYYRGGYNLDGASTTRGIDSDSFYAYGLHSQNATIRSGANTMRQNGFGIINDVISAIESGNRDDLTDKMLPKIDDFISNLLSVMSENGALQARYNYNNERLTTENSIMTETYDDLVKVDPAEAISQLMIADYMYQANLSVISRLIQPSLLDFLR